MVTDSFTFSQLTLYTFGAVARPLNSLPGVPGVISCGDVLNLGKVNSLSIVPVHSAV